jgi:hypothetical protein
MAPEPQMDVADPCLGPVPTIVFTDAAGPPGRPVTTIARPDEEDPMRLKPGLRLRSAVDTTEVIAVRAPGAEVDLRCGGAPMVAAGGDEAGGSLDPAWSEGTLLGKRYADEALGLELLCTKAGEGSLSVDGVALPMKDAKPLPASD